jgi:hypothetical protein
MHLRICFPKQNDGVQQGKCTTFWSLVIPEVRMRAFHRIISQSSPNPFSFFAYRVPPFHIPLRV